MRSDHKLIRDILYHSWNVPKREDIIKNIFNYLDSEEFLGTNLWLWKELKRLDKKERRERRETRETK